ncbi:MAG: histidine phosphatase family protein [Cellulomonadaceae bacterium]|jgi:probable phosphoglycerate mutase|nr:histidine phosphatase family protein [Cellulomonadaceae bacterium]
MTAGTVVLWRHGRTVWNVTERLQGQTDIALDEVGVEQARSAAAVLAARYPQATVVASDLTRAQSTAQAYAEVVGAEVLVDSRLRERSFGDWEGLTRAEIAAGWPEGFALWQRGDDAPGVPPGGESRADCAQRVAGAVTAIAGELEPADTLLVVSHGAALTVAITALLGLDPVGWRGISGLNNAHWSTLAAARSGGFRLTGHNLSAG